MNADLFHQTAPSPAYSPEVSAFADALEAVMSDGTHDLPGIAAGLTARGIVVDGESGWTPERLSSFLAQLARA